MIAAHMRQLARAIKRCSVTRCDEPYGVDWRSLKLKDAYVDWVRAFRACGFAIAFVSKRKKKRGRNATTLLLARVISVDPETQQALGAADSTLYI
jgi:hypothetical protein